MAVRKHKKFVRRTIAAPNAVTIFGGGITGLSAAHELVERGFRVQVWEPTPDDRDPASGCAVGGMARTQWSSVPWPDREEGANVSARRPDASLSGAESEEEELAFWRMGQTEPIIYLPWVFYLSGTPSDYRIVAAIGEAEFADGKSATKKIVQDMARSLLTDVRFETVRAGAAGKGRVVYCEVQRRSPLAEPGKERAERVVKHLNDLLAPHAKISMPVARDYAEHLHTTLSGNGKSVEFRIALLDGFPDGLPPQFGERISFRVRERWLPGEHGFRFFPAFYHHLFDTMKRTPLLEPAPKSPVGAAQERSVTVNANPDKYIETGRTAYDNLRPTESQALAFSDGGLPAVLSRSAPKSLKDVRRWLSVIFKSPPEDPKAKTEGGYGLSVRDVARFTLKMFQYMTSCDARREEYGQMTWLEYLGGAESYSGRFVKLVNDSPKALVAMDARTSDARTQGSIFTQLLLDNTQPSGFRDGTLSGPTSVAWLTPWRRYLEAQGVEFIHGKLERFEVQLDPDGNQIIWPRVDCFEPRYLGAREGAPALMPGYFVLALPPLEARAMARSYARAAEKVGAEPDRHRDLDRLLRMKLLDQPDDCKRADPQGAMRHMIGIQYYFDEDAYWLDGHYYLPLSPWGLSAISQARFWQDKADWEHGYRGILSVGLTSMDTDSPGQHLKMAWQCSPPQLAQGVWRQISSALRPSDPDSLPQPRYWHLDFNLHRSPEGQYENSSPLLVNLPGQWEERPGELVVPDWHKPRGELSGYAVEDGVVLAGNYMKTYTRLTTMEAANESARHAVNAILQHAGRLQRTGGRAANPRPAPCDIWPIEEREVDDFDFLKELDEKLYERGLGHFVEILDLDEAVSGALRGGGSKSKDPIDPLWMLAELDRILGAYGKNLIDKVLSDDSAPVQGGQP